MQTVTFENRERLQEVVPLHMAAFPGFFMTQLGPSFLREYYKCVIDYPGGILLTENSEEGCIGFVAGFVDPSSFYKSLRRRRVRLALAAAARVMTHPYRALTLVANYRRARSAEQRSPDPNEAELSSLAVAPDAAGRGVGSRLVRRFAEAAERHGAKRVVLTTDADDNAAVNAFYHRLGFECVRTFEARRGRILNEYSIGIDKVQ